MIGIIGQGFVGNAIYQKFKNYFDVHTYDLDESKSNDTKENTNRLIEDILKPSTINNNKDDLLEKSFTSPLKEARKHFEKEYLTTQLKKNHGNVSKTADFIGMERSALHRKLKELGIKGIN